MIDVSTNKHTVAFAAKVASASGSPHQFNMIISADTDNGALCTLGDYVAFDTFNAAAAPATFAGKILEKTPNGNWWIMVTKAAGAIFLYNTPKSPYPERDLRDEHLFYNGRDEGAVRGYTLIDTDIIEISAEGFSGTPVAGKVVSYENGKYKVAAGS